MLLINTDFGVVKISEKSRHWLDLIAPNWEDIIQNKRRKGKHATYVKDKFKQFEDSVHIAAAIAFINGEDLYEY